MSDAMSIALLSYIARNGPANGVECATHLRKLGFWFVELRMYPRLRRMVRASLLRETVEHGRPGRGGRPRYLYDTTVLGLGWLATRHL